MGDAELEPSPSPPEAEPSPVHPSPPSPSPTPSPSPSISITSSPSLSLPSTPSSGPHHHGSRRSPSPSEGHGGPSPALDVISEGMGELTLVIDPEVAKRACQEVLLKVKQQQGVEEGSEENGRAAAATTTTTEQGLPNGDLGGHGAGGVAVGGGVCGVGVKAPLIREEEDPSSAKSARRRQRHNPSKQSWLLRLFESKLFDVSMAISYLHNSKEPGVQAYIGNRLFSFRHDDVDFYLPQLLNMYVHMDEDVGDAIKPYVVRRPGGTGGGGETGSSSSCARRCVELTVAALTCE